MPFTFSHPAIVLPFGYIPKKWVSMTGLVVGSVCPDFEYFLRLNEHSYYSHTWKGLFWFDIPLSLVLAFSFHLVVRNHLIDNLPLFLAKRLTVFKTFSWKQYFKENYIAVIVSIIAGAASHILWDGFTHKNGIFVEQIAFLKSSFAVAGQSIPVYQFGQLSCTVIGGLIILLVLLRLPEDKSYRRQRSIVPFWLWISLLAVLFVGIRLFIGINEHFFTNLIVAAITGGLVGLIIISRLPGMMTKSIR